MTTDDREAETLPLEDAERMLDSLVDQVRSAVVKGFALAREEAEDIWADAEALRRPHSSD